LLHFSSPIPPHWWHCKDIQGIQFGIVELSQAERRGKILASAQIITRYTNSPLWREKHEKRSKLNSFRSTTKSREAQTTHRCCYIHVASVVETQDSQYCSSLSLPFTSFRDQQWQIKQIISQEIQTLTKTTHSTGHSRVQSPHIF
jgi:hypothetical protein